MNRDGIPGANRGIRIDHPPLKQTICSMTDICSPTGQPTTQPTTVQPTTRSPTAKPTATPTTAKPTATPTKAGKSKAQKIKSKAGKSKAQKIKSKAGKRSVDDENI